MTSKSATSMHKTGVQSTKRGCRQCSIPASDQLGICLGILTATEECDRAETEAREGHRLGNGLGAGGCTGAK